MREPLSWRVAGAWQSAAWEARQTYDILAPIAGWKAGDMVPAYVLSAADASGSAADNKAIGTWKDGEWTVVITRPLALTNDDDKALAAGRTYNIGFAVHDGDMGGRGHFVSFVRTVGFGADGKIKAVKLP